MIWITHDLGVVAEIGERVMVMYAGFIVEEATVDDIYEDPRHPYTLALLAALPRVDQRRDKRLKSIPGRRPTCWSSRMAAHLRRAASLFSIAAGWKCRP